MKACSRDHSRSGSRDGIALVMVLAFIVLLTILIVSFIAFTRLNRASTASYSKSIQAEEIAQGGLQDVLSDLHNEIIAGSTTYTTSTNSYATAYIPTTNLTAVPARIGYANTSYGSDSSPTALSPTLIRVSRGAGNGGDTFFTAPPAYYSNLANVPGGAILNRASAASTITPAIGGRYISAARWNKSYLLATNAAGVPAPFTTTPPDWVYVTRTGSRVCNVAADTMAKLIPSNTLTASYGTVTAGANPPASPVVGRYAFIMYDEGALLDANVAGYTHLATNLVSTPSSNNPSSVTQAVYGKSYSTYADLTQIPGFYTKVGRNTTANQTAVDNFVNWRNGSAATTAGGAIPGPNYLNAVFSYAQNGFLSFQSNASTGASDSPLVGRQDLINYFASLDANINTATPTLSQALPYLRTFSRAVNAPSWTPTLDSQNMTNYYAGVGTGSLQTSNPSQFPIGGVVSPAVPMPAQNVNAVAYKSNAENTSTASASTVANRDLANVRFAVAGMVNHYSDSGTVTSYSANIGDPLLQHRFSLARLGWFNNINPATGSGSSVSAAAIQACFGLKWGADVYGNPCWMYVGPTGSTVQTGIKTLAQVAAEAAPREPNFFELLKAGILSGSLGKDPGPWVGFANFGVPQSDQPYASKVGGTGVPAGANLYSATEGVIGISFEAYKGGATARQNGQDMHALQIGANIIDQYKSSDYYPTAIYMQAFAGETAATPEIGPVNVVYGIENLPYMTRMYNVCWHTGPIGGYLDGLNAWYQPELWNPFQAPATPRTSPTKFRLRAYGGSYLSWSQSFDYPAPQFLNDTNARGWTTGESPTTSPVGSTILNFDNNPNDAFIYFTDTGATPGFYNISRLTRSNVDASNTPAINIYPATTPIYPTGSSPLNQFAGIHGGWAPYVPMYPPNVGGTAPNYTQPPFSTVADHKSDTYYTGQPPPNDTGQNYCWVPGEIIPNPMVTFCLQYLGPDGSTWLPYSYMSRVQAYSASEFLSNQSGTFSPPTNDPPTSSVHGQPDSGDMFTRPDPLTDRFSVAYVEPGHGCDPYQDKNNIGWTFEHSNGTSDTTAAGYPGLSVDRGMPMRSAGFFYHNLGNATLAPNGEGTWDSTGETWPPNSQVTGYQGIYLGMWDQNMPQTPVAVNNVDGNFPGVSNWTMDAYYADPDGVIRPGNSYLRNMVTGEGASQLLGAYSKSDPPVTGTSTTLVGRRPLVLNRSFRSVGELGYVSRDLPFKTLDFFTQYSADAALLDLFSVVDEPSVVAGQVNLSSAPLPVLAALLAGGNKEELDSTYNINPPTLATEATAIATKMTAILNPTGAAPNPLQNRADIVTKLGTASTSSLGMMAGMTLTADQASKTYLEAPVRALSGIANTRTWNLMIDVIAQSGHMSPTAATLNDFVVEGEKRYWLHIAIDRYTGKIVDQQLEPVYE